MLRRLPFDKSRLLGDALGLIILHMATIKTWAKEFQQQPLARRALHRLIPELLLDGRCHKAAVESKVISRRTKP
jgi:hypothetical protein